MAEIAVLGPENLRVRKLRVSAQIDEEARILSMKSKYYVGLGIHKTISYCLWQA